MTKLCLGTVQFGMRYGINNSLGQPTREAVFQMLNAAIEKGVDTFDTASAYGKAEEILGQYIKQNNLKDKVKVISKLKPNIFEGTDKPTDEAIEREVHKSLRLLNLDKLDGYLLHTPSYFYKENVMEALAKLREKGMFDHFGVSIYEEGHAFDVVASGTADYIQIPYSVLDQRLDRTDFFRLARGNGMTVFARSAFLQGLLAMDTDKVPSHLEHARPHLVKFEKLSQKYGMGRIEMAMRFALANEGIDYLVFGVDTKEQLEEDASTKDMGPLPKECVNEIKKSFGGIEKSVIFPSLWAKSGEKVGENIPTIVKLMCGTARMGCEK